MERRGRKKSAVCGERRPARLKMRGEAPSGRAARRPLPADDCGSGYEIRTQIRTRRLGGGARGLEPWATTTLEAPGRPAIEVTATPCRHGPPLSRPLVGDVIGFALRWDGQGVVLIQPAER